MWFGDYILPEFCRLSHFFLQKNDVGYLSPTPNIIEPLLITHPQQTLGAIRLLRFAGGLFYAVGLFLCHESVLKITI
jgi:hypothetical protein